MNKNSSICWTYFDVPEKTSYCQYCTNYISLKIKEKEKKHSKYDPLKCTCDLKGIFKVRCNASPNCKYECTYNATNCSTTTMMSHLNTNHKELTSIKENQMKIDAFCKQKGNIVNEEHLNQTLLSFFISSNIPFNCINDPFFKDFVSQLNNKIQLKSDTYLRDVTLEQLYNRVNNGIIETIPKEREHINITIDIGNAGVYPLITTTIHYSDKDFNQIHDLFDLTYYTESHTNENILEYAMKIKIKLKNRIINSITTDSATNNNLLFSQCNFKINCIIHCINNHIKDIVNNCKDLKLLTKKINSFHRKMMVSYKTHSLIKNRCETMKLKYCQIPSFCPIRFNSLYKSFLAISRLRDIFYDNSLIEMKEQDWKLIDKLLVYLKLIDDIYLTLTREDIPVCNETYPCLISLLDMASKLDEIPAQVQRRCVDQQSANNGEIEANDQSSSTTEDEMETENEEQDQEEQEEKEQDQTKVKKSTVYDASNLSSLIVMSGQKRFLPLLEQEVFIVSSYLHPWSRLLLKKEHLETARSIFDKNVSIKQKENSLDSVLSEKPYSFVMKVSIVESCSNNQLSCHEQFEIEPFVDVSEPFSSFMKRMTFKFIGIEALFKKYCFVQPSSISSERVFSSVSFVYTKSRNKLSPEKTCKIVKIKQHLVNVKKEAKKKEHLEKKAKKIKEVLLF